MPFRSSLSGHAVVTVGRDVLRQEVFDTFEGVRTFNPEAACQHLVDDVEVHLPWCEPIVGKEAFQAYLEEQLGDAVRRPSLSLADVSGDGNVTTLDLTMSGRFGKAPRHLVARVLALKGKIYQIQVLDHAKA